MTKNSANNLLPVGFYDILFEDAKANHRKINQVLECFFEANYQLIKTPLLEFADNFKNKEITDAFWLNDTMSGKNLVLRSDITLQISRLLATRLRGHSLPLRLCYVGDVLITKNNELYADRQSTQLGLEIIGCDKEQSNFEIINITLRSLATLGLQDLLIEFSLPNFAELFLEEINAQNKTELLAAIRKKDLSTIKNLAPQNANLISEIALTNNNLRELTNKILAEVKSQKIAVELENAKKISEFITKNFPATKLCCDLFGDNRTSYHQEIYFDIFCGDFSYPIARGGRYKINDLDAVGATIYMNHLRKI